MKPAFIHHPAANDDRMWPELFDDNEFLSWACCAVTNISKETEEVGMRKALLAAGWQSSSWYAALNLFMSEHREYKKACEFRAIQELEKYTSNA